MTRDELDLAKKFLLHSIHMQLTSSAALYGVPFKNVTDAIEDYGVNLVDDFFYEKLCEIQENEEKGTHGATQHD